MDKRWIGGKYGQMKTAMIAYLLWILTGVTASTGDDESDVYCHNDKFTATCEEGEAIVMTQALYGRMSLGKCVKTDFGFVGCFVDAIDHAHSLCSGRKSCEIKVPDAALDKKQRCNQDLKSYLKAKYECVKVNKPAMNCSGFTAVKLQGEEGYISSEVAEQTRCGSSSSPWLLEAQVGQRINLTLLDFSHTIGKGVDYSVGSQESESLSVCKEYATLNETALKKMTNICGGSGIGSRHVYTSLGNTLKISLSEGLDNQHFLIKYEVVGCPELTAPERAWIKSDLDITEIGCIASDERWVLTCEGTQWSGSLGNCSTEAAGAQKRGGTFSLSMGMSIFIVLGVSAIVGLIVLAIGLIYLRRRRRRRHMGPNIPMKDIRPLREDIPYEASMYARNNAFEPVKVHVPKKCPDSADDADDNEYEYVWDISPGVLHSPDVCSKTCGRRSQDKRVLSPKDCVHSMTLPAHRQCPEHGKTSRIQKAFAQTLTLPHNKNKTVTLMDTKHRGPTLDRCRCTCGESAKPRPKSHRPSAADRHCRDECHVPQSCSFSSQDSNGDKRYISKPVATTKQRPCSHCRSSHHEHRHCCHHSANP